MTSLASQSTASGRKRKSTTTSREMSIRIPWPDPIVYSEHELKLIRGTYELMGRVGAQQLTLRYTARELGVSPGLLKYHFGDQDRLLIETMRWALQDALRRARHSLEGLTDPKAALSALLDEVFLNPKEQ